MSAFDPKRTFNVNVRLRPAAVSFEEDVILPTSHSQENFAEQ